MSDLMTDRKTQLGALILILVLGLLAPAVLEDFWLQVGALVFASSISAIGLMLLFGRVGQLSLGHPFFMAVGAYSYILLAGAADDPNAWGFGMPSVLALILAVVASGIVGFVFSPLSARLKGLSLGLATLSLVFIGIWLLLTLTGLTGGYNGRNAPPLQLGPFSSGGSRMAVLGMPVEGPQFLWYLSFGFLCMVAIFTMNLLSGRVGRAFTAVRDAEIHAAALGVRAGHYRAVAFTLSSAYAGLGGVLIAVIIQRVVPSFWELELALSYLAMIVIGGMYSVSGAILGAAVVVSLPPILQRYGQVLPGVGTEGGGGLGPSVTAHLMYGAVLVFILLFEPRGLVAMFKRMLPNVERDDDRVESPDSASHSEIDVHRPALSEQEEDVHGSTADGGPSSR